MKLLLPLTIVCILLVNLCESGKHKYKYQPAYKPYYQPAPVIHVPVVIKPQPYYSGHKKHGGGYGGHHGGYGGGYGGHHGGYGGGYGGHHGGYGGGGYGGGGWKKGFKKHFG